MKKILVAEDDHFLGNAYRLKLEKSGFEVKIARDGKEALEILNTFNADLILLDLMMPIVDGFAVLENLGKNDKFKKIPVIIASNLGQKEDIDRGMKLGAVDYIVKSDLPLEELIKKINSYIK
jgi:two-component system, OmpR family, alkaline phosphatase synthesis response regulator PhoP